MTKQTQQPTDGQLEELVEKAESGRLNQTGDAVQNGKDFNPFWHSVNVAKRITSRRPHEEQEEAWNELQAAVDMLDRDSGEHSRAVFRLVVPVLQEEVRVESLFAIARAARMTHVGHATAAVLKAKREAGLQVTDLEEHGLVSLETSQAGKVWFKPYIGKEAVKNAAESLQEAGHYEAARILRAYLEKASMNAAAARKRRENDRSTEAEDDGDKS